MKILHLQTQCLFFLSLSLCLNRKGSSNLKSSPAGYTRSSSHHHSRTLYLSLRWGERSLLYMSHQSPPPLSVLMAGLQHCPLFLIVRGWIRKPVCVSKSFTLTLSGNVILKIISFRLLSGCREVSRCCGRWPPTSRPSSRIVCSLRAAPKQQPRRPKPWPPWCYALLSPPLLTRLAAPQRAKPQSSASLRHLSVKPDW